MLIRLSLSLVVASCLYGCIKEYNPPECAPRELNQIQKVTFGGKWTWYLTTIEQWFDVGPSNFFEKTPQTEGFEYYFILTDEGKYLGYRNDTLVHDFILNKSQTFTTNDGVLTGITFNKDCTVLTLSLSKHTPNITMDTLATESYPIKISDPENHLESHRNHFVRE